MVKGKREEKKSRIEQRRIMVRGNEKRRRMVKKRKEEGPSRRGRGKGIYSSRYMLVRSVRVGSLS